MGPESQTRNLLQAAHLSAAETVTGNCRDAIAQDLLTLGQSAAVAALTRLKMPRILAARQIPLHYGPEDLDHDLATVRNRLRA